MAADPEFGRAKLRALSMATQIYKASTHWKRNHALDSLRHGEERLTSTFLLSSTFFVNGARLDKVVHYRGLPDPLRACSNPFAVPIFSATQVS
jgi:hypothetical protein